MTRGRAGLAGWSAWHAAAAYCAAAVVGTWPLARGLGRDVPAAPEEPLLAMWAIARNCEQLLAMLRGDLSRAATFFDANIFHPAPLALAYSEHYLAQAVQVLPVYAVTDNPILCYNLLFLSTFVLSGLGTYLLVRELTGNAGAAVLAGLLFAFAPYRLAQATHLQVLSAQWMPFVLYGLRRYFDAENGTRRARLVPLGGAAAALVALNLSSVSYLAYFPPVVLAYLVWEIAMRRGWRRWRVWGPAAAACGLALAITLPAAVPYAAVRQTSTGARGEVLRYSADVYSYATASAGQPAWGEAVRAFPKPGVELFPGVVPLALALVSLTAVIVTSRSTRRSATSLRPRDVAAIVAGVLAAVHVAAIVAALMYRRVLFEVAFFEVSISNIDQLLLRAAALTGIALALSPGARSTAAAVMRGPGFFVAALLAAAWLSLGPVPQALGRPVELFAPYAWLHEYVPGFDVLRVPSRFAMIAALMLAVLGGFGAATLTRWRAARRGLPVLALLFLVESLSLPFPMNAPLSAAGFEMPSSRVYRPGRAPGVYKAIAGLPDGATIAELPLGVRGLDARAVFYSIVHWRPLLNGYGETVPTHYDYVVVALSDVPRHTEAALDVLRAAGATHVVVHEDAYLDALGASTTAALLDRGAAELYRDDAAVLLTLEQAVGGRQ